MGSIESFTSHLRCIQCLKTKDPWWSADQWRLTSHYITLLLKYSCCRILSEIERVDPCFGEILRFLIGAGYSVMLTKLQRSDFWMRHIFKFVYRSGSLCPCMECLDNSIACDCPYHEGVLWSQGHWSQGHISKVMVVRY